MPRTFPIRSASIVVAAVVLAACSGKPDVAYKELRDEDPQIRADAAVRLGQAKATDAVDSLIAVARDPDEVVRVHVIRALAEIGDKRAVPVLLELASDPLRSVRLTVCQALGAIPDPSAIPTLSKTLYVSRGERPDQRRAGACADSRTGIDRCAPSGRAPRRERKGPRAGGARSGRSEEPRGDSHQEYSSIRPLIDWLDYNGYRVVTKPTKEFVDSTGRRKVKGNMDIELAIDALELAPYINHMVLFSGDGDFRSLVEAMQRRADRVQG